MGRNTLSASVQNVLNLRQASILFWSLLVVLVILVSVLRNEAGRASFASTLKILFSMKLMLPLLSILFWNAGVIVVLHRVGFWDRSMLFDTVAYIFFGAIASLVGTDKSTLNLQFFVSTILRNTSAIFIIGFFVNLFNLGWWEFVLLPIIALVTVMAAVSKEKPEYLSAYKFMNGLQIVMGVTLLALTSLHVVTHLHQYANVETLKQGVLPLILSLTFIPLLFLLCTWIAYDVAFIPIRLAEEMSRGVKWYARWRMIIHFGFNLPKVQSFNRINFFALRQTKTRHEVRALFRSTAFGEI